MDNSDSTRNFGGRKKLRKLNYVGLDIDEDLLAEAKKRSQQVCNRYSKSGMDLHYEFRLQDLRQDVATVSKDGMFDITSCQFALHYLYESEEVFTRFVGTLKRNLRRDGIFICTLFDGHRVYDLLQKRMNKQTQTSETGSEHGFQIVPQFDERAPLDHLRTSEFNIAINAVLIGDDEVILKKSTKEYLVFPDLFTARMARSGFTLVTTELFDQFSGEDTKSLRNSMSELERMYSSLHRFYIFKYIGGSEKDKSSLNDNQSSEGPLYDKVFLETLPMVKVSENCELYVRRCDKVSIRDKLCGKFWCVKNMLNALTPDRNVMVDGEANIENLADVYKVNLGIISADRSSHVLYTGDVESNNMLWLIESNGDNQLHYSFLMKKSTDDNSFFFDRFNEKVTTLEPESEIIVTPTTTTKKSTKSRVSKQKTIKEEKNTKEKVPRKKNV